jgi:hypothetical protein
MSETLCVRGCGPRRHGYTYLSTIPATVVSLCADCAAEYRYEVGGLANWLDGRRPDLPPTPLIVEVTTILGIPLLPPFPYKPPRRGTFG